MYKLKIKSLLEFMLILKQIDIYTKGMYIVEFEASLTTRKFVLGKKIVSPFIKGKYSIAINRRSKYIKYRMPEEFRQYNDFYKFISSNAVLESPLGFIEKAEDIVLTNIKTIKNKIIHIDVLENREDLDMIKFLNFVKKINNSNYLDIKFRSQQGKAVYAQYISERFLRRTVFNTGDKKVSIYVNNINDLYNMFGTLAVENIMCGTNILELPDLIQAYKDVAKSNKYTFKYVIH